MEDIGVVQCSICLQAQTIPFISGGWGVPKETSLFETQRQDVRAAGVAKSPDAG